MFVPYIDLGTPELNSKCSNASSAIRLDTSTDHTDEVEDDSSNKCKRLDEGTQVCNKLLRSRTHGERHKVRYEKRDEWGEL